MEVTIYYAAKVRGVLTNKKTSTCTNRLALQHHSVEDETDVLGGLGRAWTLFAQQVQDLCG